MKENILKKFERRISIHKENTNEKPISLKKIGLETNITKLQ